MPGVTLQWRRLGQAGVMLVQSGEYQDLTRQPRGRLAARPVRQVVAALNDGILAGKERRTVPLKSAAFLENKGEPYVHIGYVIEPEHLISDREEVTAELDRMNRVPGDWRFAFQPYISLATLDANFADGTVLGAFQAMMPPGATLHGARAQAG